MKTYLQMVNDLRIECAVSGGPILTVQGTLTGERERLVRWVRDAWLDLQNLHTDWRFHFVESTYTLEVGARVLSMPEFVADTVAEWVLNSVKIAEPGSGRQFAEYLDYVEYTWWRDNDGADAVTRGKPASFTIHPSTEGLLISPPADAAYVLFYDYIRTPQVLSADTDVPIMPGRFHDLIPAWAMRKYAYHEAAGEKLAEANEVIGRLLPQLEGDQMPEVTFGTLGE